MRNLMIAALAAALQLANVNAAFAQSTGTMNGVAHGQGMQKARCSPGDANVLVDQKAKTFVLDTSAKAPVKGAGEAPAPGSMTGSMAGASMHGKSGMVSMCKSEALSMGAQMAKSK